MFSFTGTVRGVLAVSPPSHRQFTGSVQQFIIVVRTRFTFSFVRRATDSLRFVYRYVVYAGCLWELVGKV
jgi:hypothetical protein